jgi:hypothetical protein
MTVEAVAVCPGTPLLSPQVSVTAEGVAAVQAAARDAVAALVSGTLDEVVVIGEAPVTGPCQGTWDWYGFGVGLRGGRGPGLPRALGVGAWLLDDAWAGPSRYVGVSPAESPARCASLGAALRDEPGSRALLVIGDGSARRSLKAPGHLDERAEAFDEGVAAARATADLEALAALDDDLATQLMAAGRAPWQVLAAAAAGGAWDSRLLLHEAPYGVGWLVAHWSRNASKTF